MSALFDHPWWLLLLAITGIAAVVSALVRLFIPVGRPDRFDMTERPRVTSAEFLRSLAGSVNGPLACGGSARLLNNGVEIFPAILSAITGAERTINFMVYIWDPGRVSERMFEALIERARAGVQVRLMLDGFGGRNVPTDRVAALREAGGKVYWFHPFHLGKLTRFYRRNHRRAIVVDGRIAFTGGAAVGDKWLGDAQDEEHWRDMMVELRGSIAANLQSAFVQLWANTTGEILVGEDFFPTTPDAGSGDGETWHVNVISSPADTWHPIRIFFLGSLACARERIWIANAYFAPDAQTRRTLCERARAGVDVRLLLPSALTDARVVRWAGQAFYGDLLRAGVRIWEYQPTMMHYKSFTVDGHWCVVGSANMDVRSKELNQESVLGILQPALARQIEATFDEDLREAHEIRLDEWERRSWLARVRERFWAAFGEQL